MMKQSRMMQKEILLYPALLVSLCILLYLNLLWGEYTTSVADIFKIFSLDETSHSTLDFIIISHRLPRAIAAILVGGALAASGTILQAVSGNKLAEPGILGINHGASLAVVLAIVLMKDQHPVLIPVAACLGALISIALIYFISGGHHGTQLGLILTGLAVAAASGAAISIIVAIGDIYQISQILVWLAGSFYAVEWSLLSIFGWVLPVALVSSLLMHRTLDALVLGPTLAHGIGCSLSQSRIILLGLAALLAGISVSLAGAISFVGLIAPHVARICVGGRHAKILPIAILIGALLTLIADMVGRLIWQPIDIPAGIPLTIIGVPLFLLLFRRVG